MNLDIKILKLIESIRTENLNDFMIFVTNIGSAEFIIATTLLISLFFIIYKKWKLLIVFILSTAIGNSFMYIIKNIIARDRPNVISQLVIEETYSFPSVHSFISISFYGFLFYLLYKFSDRHIMKMLTLFLLIFIVIIIGFSRMYLGVHFPSDILCGYILGLLWLLLTIKVIKILE